MLVRQFLHWVRNAPPGERADATSALARAYLYSDLSSNDLAAAEGAMTMLLDDPSPMVRRALAGVFVSSQRAPPAIVHALAADQPEIAELVLERSPLLFDADLVDMVATSRPRAQTAIARRAMLSRVVAAAVAEVGCAQACLTLLENHNAEIALFSLNRMIERFGHLAPIRENLLARGDLPVPMRQALLAKLAQTLAGYVTARRWLAQDHADYATREACEKATVALAAETPVDEIGELITHLRDSGQLTAGLILRALFCGNVVLVEEALAELCGLPLDRVTSFVHDQNISAFRALYQKAELPSWLYPAFREAIAAMRDGAHLGEQGGATRLKRGMIDRVLTRCAGETTDQLDPLLTLMRRFAVEAMREEARMYCDDLVASAALAPVADDRLVA